MGTRSLIGVLRPDNQVEYIYCHFDGYPDGGVGQTLCEDYSNPKIVDELIALGDCSCIAGCETLDDVEAYHRDRDEDWEDVKPRMIALNEYVAQASKYGAEYEYLYRDSKWEVARGRRGGSWEVMEWNVETPDPTIRKLDLS